MNKMDNNQSQVDEAVNRAMKKARERISGTQKVEPAPTSLPTPAASEGGGDSNFMTDAMSAMRSDPGVAGTTYRGLADVAQGVRRTFTNVIPGAMVSATGAVQQFLPEGVSDFLTESMMRSRGLPTVPKAVRDAAGVTYADMMLGVGGEIQSGFFTTDESGELTNLTPSEMDMMFYDPEGTAREAGEIAGQVLASVALTAAGQPHAAVALMGTTAAGSGVDSYYQYTQRTGNEYDPKMGALVGGLAGASEFLFNKIPGAIRRRVGLNKIPIGVSGVEQTLRQVTHRAFIQGLKAGDVNVFVAGVKSAFPGMVSEAVEEALTEGFQTAQQVLYRGISGVEGVTVDEILEAAMKGAMYGGAAGGVLTGGAGAITADRAARAGEQARAGLAGESLAVGEEAAVRQALVEAGLSESEADSMMAGVGRARQVGQKGRRKAPEAEQAAEGVETGPELEDAQGALRAALGDTRDMEVTQQEATQQAADAGLIPNPQEKEFILSGEEDVDTELGGPRPDARLDNNLMMDIAVRLIERFPALARAIRDKGRLTVSDLTLFLPGDAEYLESRFNKKALAEFISQGVEASTREAKSESAREERVEALEQYLSTGVDETGKPLTEEMKAKARAAIDAIRNPPTVEPVVEPTATEEAAAAVTVAAPVGGLSAMNKTKLLEIAAKLNIRGRTSMRKADLVSAIESKLAESNPASEASTETESVVAEARADEIGMEILAIEEDIERANAEGDTEAVMQFERQLDLLNQELHDLTSEVQIEEQSRVVEETETDVPTEVEEDADAIPSTGDEFLDLYNRQREEAGEKGDARLAPDEELGPIAKRAIAFINRIAPGVEVVPYFYSGDARGFHPQGMGRIYIRVGSRKSEDAALKQGGKRYRRILQRNLLDSYIQTLLHENVHGLDVAGTGRGNGLVAIDAVLAEMTDEEKRQLIRFYQGTENVEILRELRAEILTNIPAMRRAGLVSLYDQDATAFQRGMDRLRRLTTRLGGGPVGKAVLQHFEDVANAVTSSSVPRSRTAGDMVDIESQSRGRHDPNSEVRSAAVGYMASAGIPYDEKASREGIVAVDVERAKSIADLYNRLPNAIDNRDLLRSYTAMSDEVVSQYEYLRDQGYQMIPWGSTGQPYANSREMVEDVRKNKRIYYYKTLNDGESSFGSEPEMMAELLRTQPLLRRAGGQVLDSEGVPYEQTVNDLFRAVHDIFGHAKEGHQFGPRGEENAWRQHVRMFTAEARPAMTSETRGQNSWVNYGPHLRREDGSLPLPGDEDFVHPADRPYADQKIIAFPSWVTAEKGLDVEDWPGRTAENPIEFQSRSSRHVGGKTNKTSITTEDIRDTIDPVMRMGGVELPYIPGQRPILSLGTPAESIELRNVRVSYPVGSFTMADMKGVRKQAVADLRRISSVGVADAASVYRSEAKPRNFVLPAQAKGLSPAFPVFDPELLNATFDDVSLREDRRFWYEASAFAIVERTIFSPTNDVRKISDFLSATSPLTPVDLNFLRAFSIAADFEHQGFSRVSLPTPQLTMRAAASAYQNSNSYKATSFGDTMAFLAGGVSAVPLSTNDVWVGYMFGHRKQEGDKVGGLQDFFGDPYNYLYTSLYFIRLAESVNAKIRSSPEYQQAEARSMRGEATLEDEVLLTPWTPWQLQAYPWSHLSASGTFDTAMDMAIGKLEEADHPAVVEVGGGRKGIDMNVAGQDGSFSRVLQPVVDSRTDMVATLEVGGASMEVGTERYARDVITRKLEDPDLTETQRQKLLQARHIITKELNRFLGWIAGSSYKGQVNYSPTSVAEYHLGLKSKMSTSKTNNVVHDLYAAFFPRPVTLEIRHALWKYKQENFARTVGSDPDMLDTVDTALEANFLSAVGAPLGGTAGFEQVDAQRQGFYLQRAVEKEDKKTGEKTTVYEDQKGVKSFNLGYGLNKSGNGEAGIYEDVVSPIIALSMYGIPAESRPLLMRVLGAGLGEKGIGASNYFVGDKRSSTDIPCTIFTLQGDTFSADQLGPIKQYIKANTVDGDGPFASMNTDATGSHVVIYSVHLESAELESIASAIGATTVRRGHAETLLAQQGDNNYDIETLIQEFIDEDVRQGSEWRAVLSSKERQAVEQFSEDDLRAAVGLRQGDLSSLRSYPEDVRRSVASAIKKSRSFRVSNALLQLKQRRDQFDNEAQSAVEEARQRVRDVDIEFQTRMQDPTSAQFKRWFRDSVVTKVNGEPLRVYHGTKADLSNMLDTGMTVMEDFTEFRTGVSRLMGLGAYFTSSPKTADIYAGGKREFPGGRQMPVYLRIEKPFVVKFMNRELMLDELAKLHPEVADELTKLQTDKMYDQEQGEGINAIMRRLGYDGVIVRPDMYEGETRKDPETAETYIVFDPQQVKSFLVTSEQGPTEDVNIDRQSRVTSTEMSKALNDKATRFVNSAVGYGIPSDSVIVERMDGEAKSIAVYDQAGEDRRLIARYPTNNGSPMEWAEDLRDLLVSEPEGFGGWTRDVDMDFEQPYVSDDRGDEALVEYMTRSTKDIENVVKSLNEERTEDRPAGMALGHDAKAFGRWFRNTGMVLLIDEWHTLASMVDEIESLAGRKLPAKLNPMQMLRLAPGQAAEAARLFQTRTINRVQMRMKELGVNNRQLGRWMAANHALERNERIRMINEGRGDLKGDDAAKLNCGISDETANRLLQEHADDPKGAAIEEIAASLQEISYETAQIAKFAGLITNEDFDRVTGRYSFYIPMNVTGSTDGTFITDPVDSAIDRLRRGAGEAGTGTTMDVATGKRQKLKYTLGRKESEATVNAIVDGAVGALFVDRLITEGEAINNRIANRMLRMAEKYPTAIMRIATTKDLTERKLDEDADQVLVMVKNPSIEDGLIPVRLEESREIEGVPHERGEIVYIKVNDEKLSEKLGGGNAVQRRSTGAAVLNGVFSAMSAFTSLIRFTSTQFFSLGFTFTQPYLDAQTALIAAGEQGFVDPKQMVRDMSKRMPAVLSTIAKSEFRDKIRPDAETEAEGKASGPLAEYWDEFRRVGGKQQWFDSLTVEDMVKDMNAVTSNDPTANLTKAKKNLKRFTVDLYSILNDLGDNMWRFSYYTTLRENGVSAEQAGVLARNLTVDFSKKGELGGTASRIFAFFNATVQGNVRAYQQLFKGLASGKGPARKAFSFLSALGTLSALALQFIGGGDEDESGVPDYLEQIPEFERRRNIIIPYGRDENGKIKYAKMRIQYGLEIPYLLGFGVVEMAFGRRNPLELATDMATNVATAFNPLGGTPLNSAHGVLRMVLPDIGDFGLDLVMNKNWQGRQIYYGDQPFEEGGEVRSGIGSAKESFGVDWNTMAKLINRLTGGDEAYRGYVDMQPEVWRYLAGTFGGSTGRNFERMADVSMSLYRSLVLGDDLPDPKSVTVLRRWLGKGPDNPYPTYYYEVRRRVQQADKAAKKYEEGGSRDKAKPLRDTPDGKPSVVNRMKKSESSVRALRKKLRALDDEIRSLPSDDPKLKDLKIQHQKIGDQMAEVQRRMIRYYIDQGGEL